MAFVRTLAVWVVGALCLQRAAMAGPASTPGAPGPSPDTGPYLHELLKRPDFSGAYTRIVTPRNLPTWVRQGGTSTP